MNRHAAKYEHERLRPGLAPAPHRVTRKAHLLPPIAEPVAPDLAAIARAVMVAVAVDGSCMVDLVAGKFFVRKSWVVPIGTKVGAYNSRVKLGDVAEDLAHALAEACA